MLRMYCAFDKAVGAFLQPFYARATGEAIRMFTDVVNDSKSTFFQHPQDFELFSVGVFDPASGLISDCVVTRIITASEVVNKM